MDINLWQAGWILFGRHLLRYRGCTLVLAGLSALAFNLSTAQPAKAASFVNTTSLPAPRGRHTATLLPNGKVLVAGGVSTNSGNNILSSAILYDPATGTWTATGPMTTRRCEHTATLLPSGKVLVVGGDNYSSSALASAELYDPATGTWTVTGSLNIERYQPTATLLPNGKVLVVGGFNYFWVPDGSGGYFGYRQALASAELYDPATGTWTVTGPMTTAAGIWHIATLLSNGQVLVTGGADSNYNATASAQLFAPSTGTWTATGPMTTRRCEHTATLLPNGKVLIVGGSTNANYGALSSVELYDPTTGIWTATHSLTTAHAEHTATVLPNGKLLVAGGWSDSGYPFIAELYDPAAGIWTVTGSVNIPRCLHTATLLPNGQVLIAGGWSSTYVITSSAELYGDPANSPVSATLSTLTVATNSVAADGQSVITVTVTLRDANNNPVSGKTVKFYSDNLSVQIIQPTNPTDANGQASATIISTVPTTTSIWAIDTTDFVIVQQQPAIQFTSAFVSPDPDLSNAIVRLANSSSNLLTHSIAGIAADQGGYGDYFQTQITSDKREDGVNALATGIGGLMSLMPGTDDVLYEVAKTLDTGLFFDALSENLTAIAGSSTGLTKVGQKIASDNASFQQSQFQTAHKLLSGVVPVTTNYITAYTNDIGLRIQANDLLRETLSSQDGLLADLQQRSEVAHIDLLNWIFKDIDVVVTVAGTAVATPAGGKAAATGLGVSESLVTYAANQRNLDSDQQAYNTAVVSLMNCSYLSSLIDANTESAFGKISRGQPPNPVTGKIVNVDSVKSYQPLSGIIGDLKNWIGSTFANTTYVTTIAAYSLVTITNTSQQSAAFNVNALYWHTITIQNQTGNDMESMTVPMVISVITNINAGQSVQVRIDYFDGVKGAVPDDGTPISFNVLGYDDNQGIYAVDFASSTMQWQPVGSITPSAKAQLNRGMAGESDSTNLFGFEKPIKCFVYQNSTNQTYQAQIWVANPFAIPLLATITQPLPSGITVLNTAGRLESSSIVWTNMIPTNGFVEETFTFILSTLPGAQTNLPAPSLVFSDTTGTNTLSLDSSAPSFSGLFPVQVDGLVPNGVSGVDSPMQVTVTNLTGTSQTGSLTISLTDNMGNAVTNFSQTFSVSGWAGTNLNFTLPGILPPGLYLLTGSLSMNGGTGQALTGVYTVSPTPVALGASSPQLFQTNGFNLMLTGPTSSNYLVEASTDLFNWTPIIYFTGTNSPFYFNDPDATNFNQRFYRAVMP